MISLVLDVVNDEYRISNAELRLKTDELRLRIYELQMINNNNNIKYHVLPTATTYCKLETLTPQNLQPATCNKQNIEQREKIIDMNLITKY